MPSWQSSLSQRIVIGGGPGGLALSIQPAKRYRPGRAGKETVIADFLKDPSAWNALLPW